MTIDRARLIACAPCAVATVIVAIGWTLLIRPLSSSASQTARTGTQLRGRSDALRRSLLDPVPAKDAIAPAALFRQEVAARDAVPQLMEQLARVAMREGAVNLTIQTGQRAVVPSGSRQGPQVAGAAQSDPRLALFDVPVAYVPITFAFDADYARLGNVLWHLRDLPTLIEVRSLEVKPQHERGDATLHATLVMFAYGQQPSGRTPAVVPPSNAPGGSR